jgi:hypothetical protein
MASQRSYPLTKSADLLVYVVPVLTGWEFASDRSQPCRHFFQLLQFLRTHFPGAFQASGPQRIIIIASLNRVCPLADLRDPASERCTAFKTR